MSGRKELLGLADEVLAAGGCCNALDVRCEIALFEPNEGEVAIRANDAGTKIIVTTREGRERDRTFWARDYTISAAARRNTAAAPRARANTGDPA